MKRAYKLVSRKVNEVWDAVEGDRLDINYLHVRLNHLEEGLIRKM